jgi:anaerobic selenocysteine-containing dehydrogenase
VIAPIGEARSNFDFFQDLAAKMGFADPPFLQTVEARMADYLKSVDGLPEGGAEQVLVAGNYVQSTFSYPDGQILKAGTAIFPFVVDTAATEPALPCLVPPGEFGDPDVAARYPLCLITPPHPDLLNSTFGERYPDRLGEVLIHPQDASRYGISDNMIVQLANWRGATRRIARLSADTQPGLVVAEGLYWMHGFSESGINELTSQKCSDMGGGAIFHESRVRVTPVAA